MPLISFVTLAVEDVSRAAEFYRQLLQRPPTRTGPSWSFFDVDGQTLALFERRAMAAEAGVTGAPGGVGLSWNLAGRDALDAAVARAVSAGAHLTRPQHDKPWGARAAWIADPDEPVGPAAHCGGRLGL
jgi:catechol 2,3-dioxygenase-like lactoylglutathione lyase family enzyme